VPQLILLDHHFLVIVTLSVIRILLDQNYSNGIEIGQNWLHYIIHQLIEL